MKKNIEDMVKNYSNQVETIDILIETLEEEKKDALDTKEKIRYTKISKELAVALAKKDAYLIFIQDLNLSLFSVIKPKIHKSHS